MLGAIKVEEMEGKVAATRASNGNRRKHTEHVAVVQRSDAPLMAHETKGAERLGNKPYQYTHGRGFLGLWAPPQGLAKHRAACER
jgi:hypothetical protein